MPQMAPMNWTLLFISFILILLMFNSVNYFMFLYQTKSYSFSTKKHSLNWKW